MYLKASTSYGIDLLTHCVFGKTKQNKTNLIFVKYLNYRNFIPNRNAGNTSLSIFRIVYKREALSPVWE